MTLTDFETQSALWQRIEKHLEERLSILRERNDGGLEQVETARIRGSIGMIKEILAWAKPAPQINGDSYGPHGGME